MHPKDVVLYATRLAVVSTIIWATRHLACVGAEPPLQGWPADLTCKNNYCTHIHWCV